MLATKEKQSLQYYSFALSNLLAAIGGGLILGKGINAIIIPYLPSSSILAFLVGTSFGLIFLQIIPKKYSATVAKLFSIFGSITSLSLFFLFTKYSIDGKISDFAGLIFFIFLCIRFGFWFFSRVLRADAASGHQQEIAWVEFGYYVGMIIGLLLWSILNISISLSQALLIDALAQLAAGLFDIASYRILIHSQPEKNNAEVKQEKNNISLTYKKIWGWRLAATVVALTIAIQVTTLNLAHQLSEQLSIVILSFFYIGVSMAAYFCKHSRIQLIWVNALAMLELTKGKKIARINFTWISILSIACISLAIFTSHSQSDVSKFLLLFSITLAAFFFELLSLAVLDRIGLEEKMSNKNGMLIRTYSYMAISAALSLGALRVFDNSLIIPTVLALCFFVSYFAIGKRKSLSNTEDTTLYDHQPSQPPA